MYEPDGTGEGKCVSAPPVIFPIDWTEWVPHLDKFKLHQTIVSPHGAFGLLRGGGS